jgi:hypothetical protein
MDTIKQMNHVEKRRDMSDEKRATSIIGGILVLIGGFFLLTQFIPGLTIGSLWPLFVLGAGLVFLIFGVIKVHGLLIPGCILSYIGSILLYKNMTDTWDIWQFWLLVPSAVGTGIFLSELFDKKDVIKALRASWFLIALGIVLFIVFMIPGSWAKLWPLFIIAAGVMILIQGLVSVGRKKDRDRDSDTIDHDEII